MVGITKPRKAGLTAILASFLIIGTLGPLNGVFAQHDAGDDGYIVLVEALDADTRDNQVFIQPSGAAYEFQVSVYDNHGNPHNLEHWGAVLYGAEETNTGTPLRCPSSSNTQCLYSTGGDNGGTSHTLSISVPIAALAWGGEFPGNLVSLKLITSAAGEDCFNNPAHTCVTGDYNPATKALFDAGDFDRADQADAQRGGFFLLNGHLEGLFEVGNPVLNPGFEIGGSELGSPDDTLVGFKTHMAPWFLHVADEGANSATPASEHFLASNCGVAGSCASIHVDLADSGKKLSFAQFLAPPRGAPGVWVAGDELTLDFDFRTNNNFNFHGCASLAWTDELGVEQLTTRCPASGIPGGYTWYHRTYDFSTGANAIPSGARLTYLSLSLYHSWTGAPIVLFDNVKISGATLATEAPTPRNDLTDGFSTGITPYGAALDPSSVVTDMMSFNGGSAYFYEVRAVDYTSGSAETVDLASVPVTFQLLDENFVATQASHAPGDVVFGTNTVLRYVDDAGVPLNDRVLIAADPANFNEETLGGSLGVVVPWVFFDIPGESVYQDTFGQDANPTSGYYSPARNLLLGESIADTLDYAATPTSLSGEVAGSLVGASALTIRCSSIPPGSKCTDDPTPDVEVTWSTASRIQDTVTVTLVAEGDESLVLGTTTMAVPSGIVTFTLTPEQVADIAATGNYRVKAITEGSTFTSAAQSPSLKLDNRIPVPSFTISPASAITKFTAVTLADTSTDDGSIVKRTWIVRFLDDPTPDGDADTPATVATRVTSAASIVLDLANYDDGNYAVDLRVEDNEGGYADLNGIAFVVNNIKPTATIGGAPEMARSNVPIVLSEGASDADGLVTLREWDVDGDGIWDITRDDTMPLAPVTVTFATDGVHTVALRVTDNDGETTTATKTITIDGTAPLTSLTAPEAPATGWFTGPVQIDIQRSDVGTGVAKTVLVDGSTTREQTGSDDYSVTITGDGVHVLVAHSVDVAGNIGPAVETTIQIDTTAPEVSIASPTLAFGLGGVYMAGDDVTIDVDAVDEQAPVVKVVFFVSGFASPIAEDTDMSDGWSATFSTTDFESGTYEITAVAYNAAGLFGVSDTMTIVVL